MKTESPFEIVAADPPSKPPGVRVTAEANGAMATIQSRKTKILKIIPGRKDLMDIEYLPITNHCPMILKYLLLKDHPFLP
jgi:hypothetical protein